MMRRRKMRRRKGMRMIRFSRIFVSVHMAEEKEGDEDDTI